MDWPVLKRNPDYPGLLTFASSRDAKGYPGDLKLAEEPLAEEQKYGKSDHAGLTVEQPKMIWRHPMSRIDKPRANVASEIEHAHDIPSYSDDDEVAKQIQLEDGNAIQYRTCSWQKVCHAYLPDNYVFVLTFCPPRLHIYFSQSTSALPSCRSHTPMLLWVSYLVSS